MPRLLITGGAGFIGSHTCVVLLEAGHRLLVLDDGFEFDGQRFGSLSEAAAMGTRPGAPGGAQ